MSAGHRRIRRRRPVSAARAPLRSYPDQRTTPSRCGEDVAEESAAASRTGRSGSARTSSTASLARLCRLRHTVYSLLEATKTHRMMASINGFILPDIESSDVRQYLAIRRTPMQRVLQACWGGPGGGQVIASRRPRSAVVERVASHGVADSGSRGFPCQAGGRSGGARSSVCERLDGTV